MIEHHRAKTQMPVTFAQPPINEVVIGQVFEPVSALLAPHIGEFWTRFQDTYPNCAQAIPVVTAGVGQTFDLQTSIPRIWLLSEDNTRLVQIQVDRMYVNWRQTDKRNEYIRFPPIKAEFDRMFASFLQYIRERLGVEAKTIRYELTYINVFDAGSGWTSASGIGEIFKDVSWGKQERFLPAPNRISMKFQFPLPNDTGELLVSVDPAVARDSKAEVLRFELAASAGPEVVSRMSFDQWIELAHDTIVSAFADLTTHTAQIERWKLVSL